MEFAVWLILFPLIGVVINILVGKRLPEKAVGWLASAMVGASFAVAVRIALMVAAEGTENHVYSHEVVFFNWITAGGLKLDFAFLIDPLTVVMLLIVTGISTLIHIYSIGYMHGDSRFSTFFLYLNLFVFFMLILVLGNNLPVLFIGWEGVGLASYLLIGFWWEDMAKATAGMKAFVVNRIGDFGMLLAMFLLFQHLGTLTFTEMFKEAGNVWGHDIGGPTITAITLLMLLGAAGKSAQIPLFVWLPDAMAGPTPVSALIHAATMVTAGVYMIARNATLFMLSPTTMTVVAFVGATTALFAATIGVKQFDIKKILAYSTVSQLGYMVMAMGVGAFSAGVFHLMTHAFFKALLFLGAGAVIHTMHGGLHKIGDHHTDPQDIRNLGGLRKKIPLTYWLIVTATVAISGIPPFSGFFSKDEILASAFASGNFIPWIMGLTAAVITAFYMFRMLFVTFHGSYRGPEGSEEGLHESPPTMTVPLMVLAVLAVVGGWVGLPPVVSKTNAFHDWLHPVIQPAYDVVHFHQEHLSHSLEWILIGVSVLAALVGIGLAWNRYINKGYVPKADAEQTGFGKVLWQKYYVDEIYNAGVIQPLIGLCQVAWKKFDTIVLDSGMVMGSAKTVRWVGGGLRKLQTGVVGNYAFMFALGVVGILIALLVG